MRKEQKRKPRLDPEITQILYETFLTSVGTLIGAAAIVHAIMHFYFATNR